MNRAASPKHKSRRSSRTCLCVKNRCYGRPKLSQSLRGKSCPGNFDDPGQFWGKFKGGLPNGGLRPLSATHAQSSARVHVCGPLGPLVTGMFVKDDDMCRQMWTVEDKYSILDFRESLHRKTCPDHFGDPGQFFSDFLRS